MDWRIELSVKDEDENLIPYVLRMAMHKLDDREDLSILRQSSSRGE